MKIKVCGISTLENLKAVNDLDIDMVGYNFYPESKRYIDNDTDIDSFQTNMDRVGVFVKENIQTVKKLIRAYDLKYAQLHGDESVEYCKELNKEIHIIKVFRVDESFDFETINQYEFCTYYLFDTKVADYGGSGKKFNWSMLHRYVGKVPFMLSGGIAAQDVDEILKFSHPMFYGIDINSKFELSPGIKDVPLVKNFVDNIRNKKCVV